MALAMEFEVASGRHPHRSAQCDDASSHCQNRPSVPARFGGSAASDTRPERRPLVRYLHCKPLFQRS